MSKISDIVADNFNVQVPVELVKGEDASGNTVMKMRGVASTPSKDADDEWLDPKGFESDYFLKYGFMNWNHQTNKDPSSIVGRPTQAQVTDSNNYLIAFDLFNSQKAKDIYSLQSVLEDQGLALGLSIEGKVLERKSQDENHPDYKVITKARITGCAITPNPKNADTVTEIIKGENYTSLQDKVVEEDEEKEEKALSAQSSSGQAIAKESLEGDTKLIDQPKKLCKSEVIEKISRDLPLLNVQSQELLYDLTVKIQKSIDMAEETKTQEAKVSPEAIEKAREILGLAQKEVDQADQITKGEEDGAQKDQIQKSITDMTAEEREAHKAELQKGIDEIGALEKGCGDGDMKKMDDEGDMEKMKDDDEQSDEEKEKMEKMEKMKKSSDMKKSDEESTGALIKAITGTIQKSFGEVKAENAEKFAAVGTLMKSQQDQLAEIREELDLVKSESNGRKSITTKKQHVIEKGFDGAGDDIDPKTVFSVSAQKATISKALTDSFLEDGGKDAQLQKSILALDMQGRADKTVVEAAKKLGMTLIP